MKHWQVAIRNGDIRVSRKDGKADARIRAERPLFAKMVTGRANALAAVLRGADPALPEGFGRLELLDIPGRWGRIDAFGRGRAKKSLRSS